MAVKIYPNPIDVNSLTPLWKSRVEAVSTFINQRGEKPTCEGDIVRSLGLKPHATWKALDLAWNLGKIAKAGNGHTCYWRNREKGGPCFYYLDRELN